MNATPTKLVMQANGLVKRYGQVTALDGADFELRAGEILAVALPGHGHVVGQARDEINQLRLSRRGGARVLTAGHGSVSL